MKEKIPDIIFYSFIVIVVGIAVYVLVAYNIKAAKCEEKGGTMITARYSSYCIKPDSIIPLP